LSPLTETLTGRSPCPNRRSPCRCASQGSSPRCRTRTNTWSRDHPVDGAAEGRVVGRPRRPDGLPGARRCRRRCRRGRALRPAVPVVPRTPSSRRARAAGRAGAACRARAPGRARAPVVPALPVAPCSRAVVPSSPGRCRRRPFCVLVATLVSAATPLREKLLDDELEVPAPCSCWRPSSSSQSTRARVCAE